MEDKKEDEKENFQIYEVTENGKRHSILHAPQRLPEEYIPEGENITTDIFNILMADCSGSMCGSWTSVVEGWQQHIKDKLIGKTKIFVFGSAVTFIREGTELLEEDNMSGGTDLTAGLRTVRQEVEACSEANVRVFIVTDGEHGHGEPLPETEIDLMMAPVGKTVSVYLLGIRPHFPVNYSIDIRSKLHNGNATIPSLFWAKRDEDIVDEMVSIGNHLNSDIVKMELNIEGYILPGLDKTPSIHLGEWLYFDQPPEELQSISISVNDHEAKQISSNVKPAVFRHFMDYVFRQWNSVFIQQHRKKAHVPRETFDLMNSIFDHFFTQLKEETPKGKDIKSRLAQKLLKSYDVEYRTLMNQSKAVIDVEGKYKNEIELAELILKTTVTTKKYDLKNMMLKGHGQEAYEEDVKAFKKIYKKSKDAIMALPIPSPEECCRVTIMSTLLDLQDPEFHLMFEETKFDLLKSFTMTGIPVYAPVRDASQINPWTLVIKHILVNPFDILCQQVLEQSAGADEAGLGQEDKDVILQQDNEKTRFNAIVPIVPASAADVLKPLVLSNLYAMMATFCVLKNPHIIDYNAHFAALGCTWVRTIREFPAENRPEFARDRLANIVATANLYMDRPSMTRYVNALVNYPKQALMTESTDEFDGKCLKCESLIKPAFIMYLKKDKFSTQQVSDLLKLMLYEFLGRCLANYKADEPEATPFTDHLCAQLTDSEKRKAWLQKHCKAIIDDFQSGQSDLLKKYFTLDDLLPNLKKFVAEKVGGLTDKLLEELEVSPDMKRIQQLSNFGACGDIKWTSFQTWAQEMGLSKETIEETFSPKEIMRYVFMALTVKASKDRLSSDLLPADKAAEAINKKILQENTRTLRKTILKEVEEYAVKQWRDNYMKVHSPLVMPLTRQEVVEAAQANGVKVTLETFRQVYRYTEHLGLLRNACQIPTCPHYLQPHNNFNQHLSIEREQETFPHALHLVSEKYCDKGLDGVITEVISGKHSGTQKRKHPTPPVTDSLQPLTAQLESLLKVYADTKTTSTSCQQEAENDTDEFFDCTS